MAPSMKKRNMEMDDEAFPIWTRADDSEDEGRRERSVNRRQQKRRNKRTQPLYEDGIIRAETHQVDAATEFNDPEPTGLPSDIPFDGPFPPPFPPPPPPLPTTTSTTSTETASSITDSFASTTAVATATFTEPPESISSTTETVPPLDQITEAPPLPEPTDDPDSDSDSGDSGDASGPDSDSDDDGIVDEPVVADPIITATETTSFLASETVTLSSISATSTSFEPPRPTLDAVQEARQQHHRNVETALTVVGTVCGAAFLLIGAFVFWRIMKRRRRNEALDGAHSVPLPPKPSRSERLLAKFPIFGDRFGKQGWVDINEASAFDEKKRQPNQTPSFDLLGYMPDQPAPAVVMGRGGQTPMGREDDDGQQQQYFGLQYGHYQGSPPSYYQAAGTQKLATPLSGAHQRPLRESAYQPSETDSSLSSAFGNGTHIPPTPIYPLHPPPILRQGEFGLAEPEEQPSTRRDTTYTRASIASSVPRFRTIHSWVKQQTNRPFQQRHDLQIDGGRPETEGSQL